MFKHTYLKILVLLLTIFQLHAEDKSVLRIEEIPGLTYADLSEIWEKMDSLNYSYNSVYDSLVNERLMSIDEDFDLRQEKLRKAEETVTLYTEIGKRKHLRPIDVDRKCYHNGEVYLTEVDSVWSMTPIEIDTETHIKSGFFQRKYLIYNSETLVDSIFVHFATGVALPGFVPDMVFVINNKPVINYRGGGENNACKLWVDGVDINQFYDVDSAILPCFYNHKLFFVFEKDGDWGWFYDGKMHHRVWDRVSHEFGGQGEHIPEIEKPNVFKGFTAYRNGKLYTCRIVIE